MIRADGAATISSYSTGEVFLVNPSDLDWQDSGGSGRGMGAEHLFSAAVEFTGGDGQPASCEWTVSEYPEGCLNGISSVTKNARLMQDFSFSWQHQPDDEE